MLLQSLSPLVSVISLPLAAAAGYRTVGSSGCTVQMVFLPPNASKTAVFIDNYHVNYGGPGVNLQTGAPSTTSYVYDDGSGISVFGTEFNLQTYALRKLRPLSDTFCSAGAFFPDGTLLNAAGAEPGPTGVAEGFDKLRTYAPGPCTNGVCTQDWVEQTQKLQHYRWYASMQTLVDGTIVVVGGSDVGLLILNEASINVPTYEHVYYSGAAPPPPVLLPILNFTAAQNLVPGKSYNLYPILHLLPNAGVNNQIFTIAGNQTIIWDYSRNTLIKTLPDTPIAPRTFPSSATSVLLPLVAPNYTPTVLVCGGSSADIPRPVALADCHTINPYDASPVWAATDSLPNGPQTMSDGILLPDGTVLIINGARVGCGGGYMADIPVLQPLIYNPAAAAGSRFTSQPGTTIPRLYHSTAILIPSGEILVSGSNPAVSYSANGKVPSAYVLSPLTYSLEPTQPIIPYETAILILLPPHRWPYVQNNGHTCALLQQQKQASSYPTEYRVEIFSPPYMSASARPVITVSPTIIYYNQPFTISTTIAGGPNGGRVVGTVKVALSANGFHTHGQGMGQRMIMLTNSAVANSVQYTVTAPRDASVMPPGIYLLWVVLNGIPSTGVWVEQR
ncbi:hypothetical protein MMC25_006957 [Agyrium rufum]|nr:hypothetical protein [Agyrium rufum]